MAWQDLTLSAIDFESVANFSGSLSALVVAPTKSGLSFPNVLELMSDKISDGDSFSPSSSIDLIVIALHGRSLKEFNEQAASLAAAFPLPSFEAMARKTQALSLMEVSKRVRLQGPATPVLKEFDLGRVPNLRKINDAKETTAAAARAVAISTDPAGRIAAIEAFATTTQDNIAAAAAEFSQAKPASGKVIFLQGSPDVVSVNLIAAANAPDYQAVYSGAVAFIGDSNELNDLAGLFI